MSSQSAVDRGNKASTGLSVGASVASTAGLATSIFASAAASNAIPVAGQFISAGLALAGLLTKIFVGKKQKKEEARRKKQEERLDKAASATQVQATGGGGPGLGNAQGPVGATAPVQPPSVPSFSSWGGGSAPSVQPTQQVLNNKLGF